MATKSMAYDHPAYLAILPWGGQVTGSGGALRFCAFTTMIVKSYNMKPTTNGTSNDTFTAYQLSGTTTNTHVLCTYGSAASTNTQILGTFTLAAGDALSIVKGTDATGVYGFGVEMVISPGATVSA